MDAEHSIHVFVPSEDPLNTFAPQINQIKVLLLRQNIRNAACPTFAYLSLLFTLETMPLSNNETTDSTTASESKELKTEDTSEEISQLAEKLHCPEKMGDIIGSEFHDVMDYVMETMDQDSDKEECACKPPGQEMSDLAMTIVSQKYGQNICPFCRGPLLPNEHGVDDIRYSWMPIHRTCFDLWNLSRRRACEACKVLEKKPIKD